MRTHLVHDKVWVFTCVETWNKLKTDLNQLLFQQPFVRMCSHWLFSAFWQVVNGLLDSPKYMCTTVVNRNHGYDDNFCREKPHLKMQYSCLWNLKLWISAIPNENKKPYEVGHIFYLKIGQILEGKHDAGGEGKHKIYCYQRAPFRPPPFTTGCYDGKHFVLFGQFPLPLIFSPRTPMFISQGNLLSNTVLQGLVECIKLLSTF